MSRIILVTGANRGLGKQVVKDLLAQGEIVIAAARNPDNLEELERELGHKNLRTVHMDVNDDESVFEAAQELKDNFHQIDVLINNAGVFLDSRDSTDVRIDTVKKTLETNLYGPLRASQAVLPLLYKSRDPRIINVSSGMGAFSEMMGGSAAYRISKTALNSLTAIMATDLQNGVKVVAVCPGWVKTDMGGQGAPRPLEKGSASIIAPVYMQDLNSGRFYRDGKMISW